MRPNAEEVRGHGKDLGNIRNYVFIGLFLQYLQDRDVSLEERRLMEDLVGAKIRDVKQDVEPRPSTEPEQQSWPYVRWFENQEERVL